MITTNYVHTCTRCGYSWHAVIPLTPIGQIPKPVIESELHCRACGDGKWNKSYGFDDAGFKNWQHKECF